MKGARLWLWLGLGGLAYLVYKVWTQPTATGTVSEAVSNLGADIVNTLSPGAWKTSGNAPKYVPYINQVERNLGIPPDLLARMGYQESHFRDDIISGAVKSSAGAVGMFQLLPQYFPSAGVNWQTDAYTAGSYLVQLFNQFKDWSIAVGAYNFGPGNMTKYLAGSKQMPNETSTYIAQVFADVPMTGALV